MKRFIVSLCAVIFLAVSDINAGTIRAYNLHNQNKILTARLKQASRLFRDKDDLTSVIVVLPAGSTVIITGSDEDYYRVKYENDEGYIMKSHAEIEMKTQDEPEAGVKQKPSEVKQEEPAREMTRLQYLEKKYGTRIATQIYAGKIWKGMTSQMVLDSWGKPQKINRSITGNYTREEWIYRNTWLFIENNTLVDWGPIRK